ncbi:MAG: DotU family type IV/VI secretion system protein [Saccharospirillaceae bacterium]|nr:DotU family type IV/VI secretion system protein [Pseudomonadales bacterium]NRB81224.1 DotU family type IV/VI secretion system protein [Saccharospirillaceae bacterium]
MRLVDHFIDVIVFARDVNNNFDNLEVNFEQLQQKLNAMLSDCMINAEKNNFSSEIVNQGIYPVIAYIDELILCSKWSEKIRWQKDSLQRKYYSTTNIGSEFYDALSVLDKTESSDWVREIYLLVLGLGFKGKYFSIDHKRELESVKEFNIKQLLPDQTQRNLDTAILFPTAYSGHDKNSLSKFKTRLNVLPYAIGIPLVVCVSLIVFYQFKVSHLMGEIMSVVQ